MLARSSRSTSCSSWPKPFTTRTPVTASSTTPATSAACCCASQLAGNRVRREATEMNQRAGPTARATRVSSGERKAIAISEPTNSTALPSSIGTIASRPCTIVRSEIERLTIWPVCSWSWRAPSSRDRAENSCVRRSCWTSRDSWPPRKRRTYRPPKLATAATSRAAASGQMAGSAAEVEVVDDGALDQRDGDRRPGSPPAFRPARAPRCVGNASRPGSAAAASRTAHPCSLSVPFRRGARRTVAPATPRSFRGAGQPARPGSALPVPGHDGDQWPAVRGGLSPEPVAGGSGPGGVRGQRRSDACGVP